GGGGGGRPRRYVGVVLTQPRPNRPLPARRAARSRPPRRLGAADRRRARSPPRLSYFFAASAAWKPTLLCVPSHIGLLDDWPHRQSAILRCPSVFIFAPVGSSRSISPSTT